MDKASIEKQIAEYEQQAELSLASFHRLKGAAIALQALLNEEAKEVKDAKARAEGESAQVAKEGQA